MKRVMHGADDCCYVYGAWLLGRVGAAPPFSERMGFLLLVDLLCWVDCP